MSEEKKSHGQISHFPSPPSPPDVRPTRTSRRSGAARESPFQAWLIVAYRYRYVAISVILLVALSALLRAYLTTPLYRAVVRLIIEIEDESTVATAGALERGSRTWVDPKVFYATQYNILSGSEVARRVVHREDVRQLPEFRGPGASPLPESTAIELVVGRVSAQAVQNSRLVDVTFVSADAASSAVVANAIAEEYVQQNLELRRRSVMASLDWLQQELENQRKKVESSERAMAQYREEQNALSLEEHQNIVVSRLNQLNDAATKAKTIRLQKQALYDQVNSLGADASAESLPVIQQNVYIQSLKGRLANVRSEKAVLFERYGARHAAMLKVEASVQDAARQLEMEIAKAIEAIKHEYQSALVEEQTLQAALDAQKSEAIDLNRKGVSYVMLEREAHSNRQF